MRILPKLRRSPLIVVAVLYFSPLTLPELGISQTQCNGVANCSGVSSCNGTFNSCNGVLNLSATPPTCGGVSVCTGISTCTGTLNSCTTAQGAPALTIAKTHSGNFTQGQQSATYTVTVSNAAGAVPTSGTVTVTETVPAGLTLVSMAGDSWTCPSNGTTCTRADPLAAGSSYSMITVTVNVAMNAPASVTNQVSVSGGGSAMASANDPATIIPLPLLSIAKSHTGNFTQGQAGATYTVTVSNGTAAGPTSGSVTVTEMVPAGLILVSMSGTGWTCPSPGTGCTRSDPLGVGASYPPITVTVDVANNAPASVTNLVGLSGGGSPAANASDLTTISSASVYTGTQYFAYVANSSSGNVSAYTINPASGVLTTVPGSPFAAGSYPDAVAVDPSGRVLYVANGNSYTVAAYTINPANGVLTAVPGSPFSAGSNPGGSVPSGIAIDPTGQFAYVAIIENDVSAYSIDPTTGALTVVPGSPFPAGSNPNAVAVDPTGQFVYVTNRYDNNVSAYIINPATGALTAVAGSPFAAGSNPSAVTVDPTGQFVYVANWNDTNVSAYIINPATGALSAVPGSPFAAVNSPESVVVDPTGKFVYVANFNAATDFSFYVSGYAINPATGALTAVSGSPFAAGSYPDTVTVDPTGHFLYVANWGAADISALTINHADGALTSVSGSPFASGGRGSSVVTALVNGPVLHITKSHTGNFTPGQNGATYAVTVSNAGLGPTSGVVMVSEKLPVGLTLVSMGGSGWTCPSSRSVCTRGDALPAGTSYPTITVIVNVSATAASPQVNTVLVSGGGSPSTRTTDSAIIGSTCTYSVNPPPPTPPIPSGTGSATVTVTTAGGCAWSAASDSSWLTITSGFSGSGNGTVNYSVAPNAASTERTGTLTIAGLAFPISQLPPPVLTISSSHTGNFFLGQTGASYVVTVSDSAGTSPALGTVIVTENLPVGLTLVSMSGTGWTCAANTCTRSDVLNAGSSYPTITVAVNVASNAAPQVTNQVTVLGGGSDSASANDVTTITSAAPGFQFVPVTPCRVMDTRGSAGAFGGPNIGTGATRVVPIPQSACNIPSTAQAYSLNVTVVPPGPLSYLSIWPTGVAQPVVSTLNSFDGRIVANAAIVPAGTNGAISLYASDATQVILDINGYFVPASTSGSMSFYAATPCRVADTRNAAGPFGGPYLSGGTSRTFAIQSSPCGIPGTAQAYSLNITALPHRTLGYLTTWPAGQAQPYVSTLNSLNGAVVANAAIVPAGSSPAGGVSIFVTDDTDVIIDINGYFAPPGSANALLLYTMTPCRVVDTRGATGPFGGPSMAANATRAFAIPASACSVPATAQAYSLNVTVVPPGPLIYLSAWPAGQSQPVVSTLNSFNGAVVANAAIVPAGTSGAVDIFVSDQTHVILDINAYFAQ